jgi:hypothetical protein
MAWAMGSRLVAAGLFGLAMVALAPGPLRAQPQPYAAAPAPPPVTTTVPEVVPLRPVAEALVLQPGATCLEHDTLAERVGRWLRRDAIDARIRVSVRGDAVAKNRVSFTIERGAERAERAIADAPIDCDQLHSAIALSIALAIDASLGQGAVQETGPELPADEQLLAPVEKAPPPGPPYIRLALGLFAHATSGVLTEPSWGASGRLELGFVPWLDVRLSGFGAALDKQVLRGADEGSFGVALFAGRLDGCAVVTPTAELRALACLGALGGALHTRGHGFAPEQSEDRLWVAVVGGIEAQAQLARFFALAASVDLLVPLARHRIQVFDAQGVVAGERVLTPVGVLIGVGPVLRFF